MVPPGECHCSPVALVIFTSPTRLLIWCLSLWERNNPYVPSSWWCASTGAVKRTRKCSGPVFIGLFSSVLPIVPRVLNQGLSHSGTWSGTLQIPKESGLGIWVYPHKLQFSRDGLGIWFVSLFTVVLVVVLDTSDYMRYMYISYGCNHPYSHPPEAKPYQGLRN